MNSLFDTILLIALWVVVAGYLGLITSMRKTIFGHENVTQSVFQVAVILAALGTIGAAAAALFALRGALWHAILALPLIVPFFLGIKVLARPLLEVKSNPPQKGILEVWGTRILKLLNEAKYRDADFWPFNVKINPIWVGTIPFRFAYKDVPCKAEKIQGDGAGVGALVDIEIVGVIQPDHQMNIGDDKGTEEGAKRIVAWMDNHGNDLYGDDGTPKREVKEGTDRTNPIMASLDSAIGQELRKIAIQHTWETLAGIKVAIAASLVALVSGARPRKLPRTDGKLNLADFKKLTPEQYMEDADYETIDDPVAYIQEKLEEGDRTELELRLKELQFFSQMLTKTGMGDVAHMGFQINVLNAPNVDPTGDVKAATNRAAAELKDREGEDAQVETRELQAERLLKRCGVDKPTPEQMAWALSEVRRNLNPENATQETFVHGSGGPIIDAAAMIAGAKRS